MEIGKSASYDRVQDEAMEGGEQHPSASGGLALVDISPHVPPSPGRDPRPDDEDGSSDRSYAASYADYTEQREYVEYEEAMESRGGTGRDAPHAEESMRGANFAAPPPADFDVFKENTALLPTVHSRRAKSRPMSWICFDDFGGRREAVIDKHQVRRLTGVPPRDLRVMDPTLAYPSSIMIRERALVVNMEYVKAIITADFMLILMHDTPSFLNFSSKLESRMRRGPNPAEANKPMPLAVQAMLQALHSRTTDGYAPKPRTTPSGRGIDGIIPQLPPALQQKKGGAHGHDSKHGAQPKPPHDKPDKPDKPDKGGSSGPGFRLRKPGRAGSQPLIGRVAGVAGAAAGVAGAAAGGMIGGSVGSAAAAGIPATEPAAAAAAAAPASVPEPPPPPPLPIAEPETPVPFELRALETCLVEVIDKLCSEVDALVLAATPIFDRLTHGVSRLHLETARKMKTALARLDKKVENVHDELEKLLDNDMELLDMCLTRKRKAQMEKELEMDGGSGGGGGLGPRTSTSRTSLNSARASPMLSPAEMLRKSSYELLDREAVEVLENMVETYFEQLDGAAKKLDELREYMENAEDYVNIELDAHRNQLIQLELLLTIGALCIGVYAAVGAVFGMNIQFVPDDELPEGKDAPGPEYFWTVVSTGAAASAVVFVLIILYCRWKRLLFV